MRGKQGVILVALALAVFVTGITLGGTLGVMHLMAEERPQDRRPAEVYSTEILEAQEAAGLYTNYRQGETSYLEVLYEGEWQGLKCSLDGWTQQGLYFRHNLAAVAEGCELETLVKFD